MHSRLKLAASVVACSLFLALCIHTTQRHVELLQSGRLDRTIAELRASEHAALEAMHRSQARSPEDKLERLGVNIGNIWPEQKRAHKAVTQGLHKAWIPRETNPRLETEGHVNTGVEFERNVVGDNGVNLGDSNPSMPYGAGRERLVREEEQPTARPPNRLGKLDKLGVNTGALHDSWDDGMHRTQGMEDSYSFGSTPVREDNSPLATVGLLASVPSRVFPGRVFGQGDAHSYFQNAVMPFMKAGIKKPVHKVDTKLFKAAQKEKQEAIDAEKKFEKKIAQAKAAERRAHEVEVLAEGVSTAKQAVMQAKLKETAAEKVYDNELMANQQALQKLGAAPVKQSVSQSDLDKAVAGDRRENKALSTDKDVGDVLGALNGLPNKEGGSPRQNKAARKSQLSSQPAATTSSDSWCSYTLIKIFC